MNKFEKADLGDDNSNFESGNNESQESKFESIRRVLKRLLLVGLTGAAITIGAGEIRKSVEYDKYVETQGAIENKVFDEIVKELGEKIGNNVRAIELGSQKSFDRRNDMRETPKFDGVEEAGFSPEVVEGLFEDGRFYPKNLLDGQVSGVTFYKGAGPSARGEGIQDNAAASVNSIDEIDIYVPKLKDGFTSRDQYVNLMTVMEHEIAHLNDWETNLDLCRIDRALLLKKVLERLGSPDRLAGSDELRTFDYEKVEMDDEKNEAYRQAKEYWATIVQFYFDFPAWFKDKHPSDFQLVEDYLINKKDSNFNPIKANQERKAFLSSEVARQQP